MKAKPYALKIACNTNDDYNGIWYKDETENECKEIGINLAPKELEFAWMDYIFNHLFVEESEWTQDLNDSFTQIDTIQSITIKLGDDIVKIEKLFKR